MTPEEKPSTKKIFSWKELNKWKVAFFVLIGIVIGSSIFLFTRITEKEILQNTIFLNWLNVKAVQF